MEKSGKYNKTNINQAYRCLIIAPSNYGKSMAVSNFVLQDIKNKKFHPKRIIIISPTHRSDPSQLLLINECQAKVQNFMETNCFLHLDDLCLETLEMIFNTNQQIKDMGKPIKNYLVIMDDVISETALKQGRGILQDLATKGRHYSISTIISLQAYRSSINTTVRSQCSIIMIGRLLSINEIEDLASIYNQGLGKNKKEATHEFLRLWELAIQKNNNHGFLVINTYIQYGQGRIQLGSLDEPFYDKP